jgi:uncharacterized protein with PQ loop repeat
MAYDYLMNTASALFFVCYIPELYANWKNKNANFYNMPEKAVMLIASGFAFSYSIANADVALISNYGPILVLDIVAFLMRLYYVRTTPTLPLISDSVASSGGA